MPRFSFPVPGRRRKQVQESVISPPLNKVQRFLGAADINVDLDAHLSRNVEPARNWDAASCISITVPESSTGPEDYSRTGGLASPLVDRFHMNNNNNNNNTTHRQRFLDEESGILPRTPNDFTAAAPGDPSDDDSSSIRRQHSSSTITSFYDKSKVPLVISQQTSSSAMAKGLPPKANTLLDIDGSLGNMNNAEPKKTKPARLDLSHLLHHRRPSNTTAVSPLPSAYGAYGTVGDKVLSPNTPLTRTHSLLTSSPFDHHAGRPKGGHHAEKKLQKRDPGSLSRLNSINHSRRIIAPPLQRGMTDRECNGLQNLYEHYEQMSFRDTTAPQHGQQGQNTHHGQQHSLSHDLPHVWPDHEYRKWESAENLRGRSREPAHARASSQAAAGTRNRVHIWDEAYAFQEPQSGPHGRLGYSESVSSHHTRASRASRTRSLMDVDLLQTSVLSLSSDSEDEDPESRPRTSISVPAKKMPPTMGDSTPLPDYRRPGTSNTAPPARKTKMPPAIETAGYDYGQGYSQGYDQSYGQGYSQGYGQGYGYDMPPMPEHTPATIRGRSSTSMLRVSGTSVSTNSTVRQLTVPKRSSSRTSRTSDHSNNTVNTPLTGTYTVHEARAITLVPAQGSAYDLSTMPADGTSPEELTPPLSPMSIEFYARSIHGARSSSVYSTPSVGHSSRHAVPASNVMAVTQQEEQLLAALRQKRTRMQESSLAEFEEPHEAEYSLPGNTGMPIPPHQARQPGMESIIEVQSPQPHSVGHSVSHSLDRFSVNFKDFPLHYEDGSLTGSRSDHLYDTASSPGMNEFAELDDDASGSLESYDSYLFPADHSPPDSPEVRYGPGVAYHGAMPDSKFSRQSMQAQRRMHGESEGSVDVRIMDERTATPLEQHSMSEGSVTGVPRPDSPIEAQRALPRKKGLRISAVGGPGLW